MIRVKPKVLVSIMKRPLVDKHQTRLVQLEQYTIRAPMLHTLNHLAFIEQHIRIRNWKNI